MEAKGQAYQPGRNLPASAPLLAPEHGHQGFLSGNNSVISSNLKAEQKGAAITGAKVQVYICAVFVSSILLELRKMSQKNGILLRSLHDLSALKSEMLVRCVCQEKYTTR